MIGSVPLNEPVVGEQTGRLHVDQRTVVEFESFDDFAGQLVDVDQCPRHRAERLGRVGTVGMGRVRPPDLLLVQHVRLGGIIAERRPNTGEFRVSSPQRVEHIGLETERR